MLFAGAERSQSGMSGDDTSWKACIGGNGFVAGVAGDAASVGMADDASHDENGGVQTHRGGEVWPARGRRCQQAGGGRGEGETFAPLDAGRHRSKKKGGSRG